MDDLVSTIREVLKKFYAIESNDISRLPHGHTNHNFLVTAKNLYIIKALNPQYEEEMIYKEIDFLKYLKKHEFPLVMALKNNKGTHLVNYKKRFFVVYPYFEHDLNGVTFENAEDVGALYGRLHNIPVPNHLSPRPDRRMIWKELLESKDKAIVDFFKKEFLVLEEKISHKKLPKSIIHADAWAPNFLTKNNSTVFLDWESVDIHHRLLDLACAARGICYEEEEFDYDLYNTFLRGYTSEVQLTQTEKDTLYEYILYYLLWATSWRYVMFEIRKERKDIYVSYTDHKKKYESLRALGKEAFMNKLQL